MYRVELKAQSHIGTKEVPLGFLMYRVELKVIINKLEGVLIEVPNVPCGVER